MDSLIAQAEPKDQEEISIAVDTESPTVSAEKPSPPNVFTFESSGLRTLLVKLIESAIPIAIVSGGAYYVGYIYYGAYFGVFSSVSAFPPLTAQEYFLKFTDMVTSSYVFQILMIVIPGAYVLFQSPSSKRLAMIANAPLFLVLFVIIVLHTALLNSGLFSWSTLLTVMMYLGPITMLIFLTVNKQTPISAWRSANLQSRTYWTIWAVFLFLFLGRSIVTAKAEHDARRFLEGQESGQYLTIFDMRSDRPDIEEKTFRVVLHRDGNYYVVPADANHEQSIVLVVIPDTEIISISTEKI